MQLPNLRVRIPPLRDPGLKHAPTAQRLPWTSYCGRILYRPLLLISYCAVLTLILILHRGPQLRDVLIPLRRHYDEVPALAAPSMCTASFDQRWELYRTSCRHTGTVAADNPLLAGSPHTASITAPLCIFSPSTGTCKSLLGQALFGDCPQGIEVGACHSLAYQKRPGDSSTQHSDASRGKSNMAPPPALAIVIVLSSGRGLLPLLAVLLAELHVSAEFLIIVPPLGATHHTQGATPELLAPSTPSVACVASALGALHQLGLPVHVCGGGEDHQGPVSRCRAAASSCDLLLRAPVALVVHESVASLGCGSLRAMYSVLSCLLPLASGGEGNNGGMVLSPNVLSLRRDLVWGVEWASGQAFPSGGGGGGGRRALQRVQQLPGVCLMGPRASLLQHLPDDFGLPGSIWVPTDASTLAFLQVLFTFSAVVGREAFRCCRHLLSSLLLSGRRLCPA